MIFILLPHLCMLLFFSIYIFGGILSHPEPCLPHYFWPLAELSWLKETSANTDPRRTVWLISVPPLANTADTYIFTSLIYNSLMSLLSVTTGCKGTRLKQMTAESRECDVSVRSSSRGHGDVWERVIHHTAPLRSHSVPQSFNYMHFSGLSQHAVCERANSHQKSRELHSVASSTHLSEPWDGVHALIRAIYYAFNYQLEIHFHYYWL